MSILKTTPKQKIAYIFIKKYTLEKGYPPSLEEVREKLGIKSISTAYKHIDQLRKKGLIKNLENPKRSIALFEEESETIEIPLLGQISAGSGIEPRENPEPIKVQKALLCGSGNHYALRVVGNSMIEDGIADGDTVIIRSQNLAQDGDTVVAIMDEGDEKATIKKFYMIGDHVELRAKNKNLKDWPKQFKFGEIEVRGKFCGLLREVN